MDNDKMPFTAHLSELRQRIFISLIALFIAFVISFHYSEILFKGLTFPLRKDLIFKLHSPYIFFLPKKQQLTSLVFLAPAEAFWMHLKVALVAAIILSLPVLLSQVWRFITPGLLLKERRLAFSFVIVGTILFLIGAAFCFTVVLPFAMRFLLTYKTESLEPMISVGNYIDFCLKFILAFGFVFELPIVLIFLTKMGMVTPQKLAKKRKYAIILAFVAAALLTPTPDAFNQTLTAGPIILLYEIGIIGSKLFYRKNLANHG